MDKNAIKKFAVWARRELISRVSQKAAQFGIEENNIVDGAVSVIGEMLLSKEQIKQRQALIAQITVKGYRQVMEEVAYTWFNRFIALRFMEVNNYLPSHIRVFTNEENEFKPQILTEAIRLELDGLDIEKVYALKAANKTEELYRYLLITQCNALNQILPKMFQKITDYTELLLPDNLLREGSVIEQMLSIISWEDWLDAVQIIGWLYQYYNAEKKDEVFIGLKKNIKITKENMPAATQLFTPDWIVRYMVENSLGRLWLEGHPNADLQASWKYYLKEAEQESEVQVQLAEIRKEYAALTPEEIKCIDPCCGSGHILVYLFDVLMQIYESYGYTAREAVESIIKNNLYGLDIDDRAVQLAYFAVMMKARQYDRRFFGKRLEPHIYAFQESNTINYNQLKYFGYGLNEQERKQAGMQIRLLMDTFRDAKEYGSILNVEQYNWELLYHFVLSCHYNGQLNFDTIGLEDTKNKLFELVQIGIILTQKYDVVCTNPPYMWASGMGKKLSDFVKEHYPDSKSDLFACCIEKGNWLVRKNGFNCMVTMQSWMFLNSFEKMRLNLLQTRNITNLMHMENMVMGIAFGTAVTIFRNNYIDNYKGTYNCIKLSDIKNNKLNELFFLNNRIIINTNNFFKIPGSPLAYWVSEKMLEAYQRKNAFLGDIVQLCAGLATGNNEIFERNWYEVNFLNIGFEVKDVQETIKRSESWYPCNSSGDFRKWATDDIIIVNWKNNGERIKSYRNTAGKLGARPQNTSFYFKEGLTWNKLSSSKFAVKYKRAGYIFDDTSRSAFPIDLSLLKYYIGLLCSVVTFEFLKVLNPTMSFTNNDLVRIPYIEEKDKALAVIEFVDLNIILSKTDWDSFETSWDFKRHPLLNYGVSIYSGLDNGINPSTAHFKIEKSETFYKIYEKDKPKSYTVQSAFEMWEAACNDRFKQLKANEEELNRIFIDIYGLQDELTPEVEDKDVTVRKADLQRDIRSLISYAVGCMFGRYSLDTEGLAFAGGEWDNSKYITFSADKDNIIPICDDEYFTDDIVGRFIDFIATAYGNDTLDINLKFIAEALGGKGQPKEVIRSYFLNNFYADHCKIYQKRPIYWLFESGKNNGFKALIYMHRYQPDTIARVRTDYIHEQQARYRTAIADLEQRVALAAASDRVKLNKKLKKLIEQDAELHSYEEKIHHLADQMISIDLDDGIKVNYAKFQDVLAKIK